MFSLGPNSTLFASISHRPEIRLCPFWTPVFLRKNPLGSKLLNVADGLQQAEKDQNVPFSENYIVEATNRSQVRL